jgi:hypothetical protein
VQPPALSPDGLSVLLFGNALTPSQARSLSDALRTLSGEAAQNQRVIEHRAHAAELWAEAEGRSGVILASMAFGTSECDALLWRERDWWIALPRGKTETRRVRGWDVLNLPAPLLVRDPGCRTRHWWQGGRTFCGNYTDGMPDTTDKYRICPKCTTKAEKKK